MFKELFRMFARPKAITLAQEELEEAKRRLLVAQTGAEYAVSQVNYREVQVARLSKFVSENK